MVRTALFFLPVMARRSFFLFWRANPTVFKPRRSSPPCISLMFLLLKIFFAILLALGSAAGLHGERQFRGLATVPAAYGMRARTHTAAAPPATAPAPTRFHSWNWRAA